MEQNHIGKKMKEKMNLFSNNKVIYYEKNQNIISNI